MNVEVTADGSRYISCFNGKIVFQFRFSFPAYVQNLIRIVKPVSTKL